MNKERGTLRHWTPAGLALLAISIPGAIWGQSLGDCIAVEVPAPMILPDGSSHEAGSLKICHDQMFSPIASLHATYVDGKPVGFLRSRRGFAEDDTEGRPYVLFQKTHRGELRLLGYAWPHGNRMATYLLAEPDHLGEQIADTGTGRKGGLSVAAKLDPDLTIRMTPGGD